MGETKAPHDLGVFPDQPGQQCRLHCVQCAVVVQAGYGCHGLEVEFATDDGGDEQYGVRLVRQLGQTPAQHIAHPGGNLEGRRVPVGRPGQPALAAEQPQQFDDEERVAVGAVVHQSHQLRVWFGTDLDGHHPRHLEAAEAAEHHPVHGRFRATAPSVGSSLSTLSVLGSRYVARTNMAARGSAPATIDSSRSDVGIRPVQIVKDDQQRSAAGQASEQAGDGMAEPESNRLHVDDGRW